MQSVLKVKNETCRSISDSQNWFFRWTMWFTTLPQDREGKPTFTYTNLDCTVIRNNNFHAFSENWLCEKSWFMIHVQIVDSSHGLYFAGKGMVIGDLIKQRQVYDWRINTVACSCFLHIYCSKSWLAPAFIYKCGIKFLLSSGCYTSLPTLQLKCSCLSSE